MNTFGVDIDQIAVIVKTDGETTRLPFKTKHLADRKILELIEQGYKFDRNIWYGIQKRRIHLRVQARDLCNALCHKLYDWSPDPERAARLERILDKARDRLARREQA